MAVLLGVEINTQERLLRVKFLDFSTFTLIIVLLV